MSTAFWILAGIATSRLWVPVAAALVRGALAADEEGREIDELLERERLERDPRERERRRRAVPRRFRDEGITWSRRRTANRAWDTGRPSSARRLAGGFERRPPRAA